MSKVYIVTAGIYSDYHICAASLDKEHAEILAEKYTDRFDKAVIEEYELDEFFEEANRVLHIESILRRLTELLRGAEE